MDPTLIGMLAATLCLSALLIRMMKRPRFEPIEIIEGCRVRMNEDGAGFVVEHALPGEFELLGNAPYMRLEPAWSSGNPMFDRKVSCTGDERWLAARMSGSVRAAIDELVHGAGLFTVTNGALVVRLGTFPSADEVRRIMISAVRVARLLSEPITFVDETERNAEHDPHPRVRQQCLEIMVRDHSLRAKKLAERMMISDADAWVRYFAAVHAGVKGLPILRAFAFDSTMPPKLRAAAIREWVRAEMFDEARSGLRELARSVDLPATVMVAVARSMAEIGGAFEDELVGMVATGEERAKLAALEALEQLGTLASVQPLQMLVQRLRGSVELRHRVERTVAIIQGAAGGDRGRLSVVEEDRGELSMAEGGALSIERDD